MAAPDKFARSAWMLASVAVVVSALYLAKAVLVPMTLAVLLSFLLSPVCDWFERHKLGRIPAVLVTVFLGFAVLGVATWTAVMQMGQLAPKLPEYRKNVEAKVQSVNQKLTRAIDKFTTTAHEIGKAEGPAESAANAKEHGDQPIAVRVLPSPASPAEVIGGTFGSILEGLGSTGVVILLVVFFLIRREDLRDRFVRLVGQGDVTLTTHVLEDAAARVSRYLATQFVINVSFGVPVAIGLYFIGVPNALLWGILATLMRFVPYVGSWIAAAMPIGLSMAISPSWVAPLLTFGLFLALELIIANVLEPWLYGKHTGVSAVAVLVAAVFWTWLWGSVGLLLATPLTVCLLVLGKHIPQLAFLDVLLGNEPVFEPKTRVYQRLLAGDQEEATELVEECLEHSSHEEVYDSVLIPALAMAKTDRHRGNIDEGREKLIFQGIKEVLEDLGERRKEPPAQSAKKKEGPEDIEPDRLTEESSQAVLSNAAKLCIVCLPARNQADEIAGLMLGNLLELGGFHVETISETVLASEIIGMIEQHKADVVCISAMPPAAATHARYLSKRLRGRIPEERLMVGLWGSKGDLAKARARVGCSDAVRVVGTLAQAQEQIRIVLQPLLARRELPPEPHLLHNVRATLEPA